MTPTLQRILSELEQSGSSESLAVADCLQTIAGNGGEQDTDIHLLGCAGEIAEAAQSIMTRMKKTSQSKGIEPTRAQLLDFIFEVAQGNAEYDVLSCRAWKILSKVTR